MNIEIPTDNQWADFLHNEFSRTYFARLNAFLNDQSDEKKLIYPPASDIFRAFSYKGPSEMRVFVLGQDPYHGEGQAHGLAFSVPDGVKQPPSLKNIFKELQNDIGCSPPQSGNLVKWAEQGVMLLNTVLTVEASKAGSHRKKGWETFTDEVIKHVSEKSPACAFLLWGNPAQEKEKLIDCRKHIILKAAHPSPLSAYRGFFGCRHFSRANTFLCSKKQKAVNWCPINKEQHFHA